MPITETTFDFEELQLPEFGEGALFYGQARLIDNSGDIETFAVDDIRLNNNHHLYRGSVTVLERELFKAICEVLYDARKPNTVGYLAASEWADHIAEQRVAA